MENMGISEIIEKDDDDRKKYGVTKIKQESIDNSELINVNLAQKYCARLENNPSLTKDDQKIKKKFDCSCSGKSPFHHCSETCTKYPSLSSKEYCSSISTEDVRQLYDHGDISTNDSTALSDIIPKASIPTTVIVTINNNFKWQADPDANSSGEMTVLSQG